MKPLQRTLAMLAFVVLLVQTVRHSYMLWIEPRSSVLDKYERSLNEEIAGAASLDELVRRFDAAHKEAERVRAERRAAGKGETFEYSGEEPFKTERSLKEAISDWERKENEVRSLRFYSSIGFLLIVLGVTCYLKANRWLGITLLMVAFAEAVYWTSPTFTGPTMRETDRLLLNKLGFSLAFLVALGLVVRLLHAFDDAARDG
jgi:hypothetical protein